MSTATSVGRCRPSRSIQCRSIQFVDARSGYPIHLFTLSVAQQRMMADHPWARIQSRSMRAPEDAIS